MLGLTNAHISILAKSRNVITHLIISSSCWIMFPLGLDDVEKPKYHNVWVSVKRILVLSHRNADPERGFSINKRLIDIHGYNIQEKDIEAAVRLVKDDLNQPGGLENIVINKRLIQMCSDAHLKYGWNYFPKLEVPDWGIFNFCYGVLRREKNTWP